MVGQLVETGRMVGQLVETWRMVGQLVEMRGPHTQPSRNILAHGLYMHTTMCQYICVGDVTRVSGEAKRTFGGKFLPVE